MIHLVLTIALMMLVGEMDPGMDKAYSVNNQTTRGPGTKVT
jgi:hypothetical protein